MYKAVGRGEVGIEGWLFARKGLEREGTATTVH